jgi:hypothetical protein
MRPAQRLPCVRANCLLPTSAPACSSRPARGPVVGTSWTGYPEKCWGPQKPANAAPEPTLVAQQRLRRRRAWVLLLHVRWIGCEGFEKRGILAEEMAPTLGGLGSRFSVCSNGGSSASSSCPTSKIGTFRNWYLQVRCTFTTCAVPIGLGLELVPSRSLFPTAVRPEDGHRGGGCRRVQGGAALTRRTEQLPRHVSHIEAHY